MLTLDSLPQVPQGHIESMKREADKKMKAEGLETYEQSEAAPTEPTFQEQPLVESQPAVIESEQPTVSELSQEVVPAKESWNDRNIRVLRQRAERVEQERNDAIKRLQELEQERLLQSYKTQQQFTQKPEHTYEDIQVAPDDLLEGKHLSPIQKEIKDLKQSLQQQQQQNIAIAAGNRLRAQFPDFDKVVTKDTITLLQELEPEIARTLDANTDIYSTGASAYKIIKQLGIYVEDTYQPDKLKAQQNVAKPKSLATISPQKGESPLTQANAFAQGLTPELQKQLRAEMEAARRSI